MAPAPCPSSPLSSLSSLTPLPRRSPTPSARSPPRIDILTEHPSDAHRGTASGNQQHTTFKVQSARAEAGAPGQPLERGDRGERDDVKMSEVEVEGTAAGRAASSTVASGGEGTLSEVGKKREREVKMVVDQEEVRSFDDVLEVRPGLQEALAFLGAVY